MSSHAVRIYYISEVLGLFDTYLATIDHGNAYKLMGMFRSLSTCIITPAMPMIGWCSSNKIIIFKFINLINTCIPYFACVGSLTDSLPSTEYRLQAPIFLSKTGTLQRPNAHMYV